jgi:hypothetical protein
MTEPSRDIRYRQTQLDMQLVSSRKIPSLDSWSLAPCEAREVLFRTSRGFLLYLSNGKPSQAGEERVISLDLREALIWLNEASDQRGSFWT